MGKAPVVPTSWHVDKRVGQWPLVDPICSPIAHLKEVADPKVINPRQEVGIFRGWPFWNWMDKDLHRYRSLGWATNSYIA